MIHLTIGRNLDLSLKNDQDYFYSLIQSSKGLPFTIEEIKGCVDFLSTHLKQEEWLKIYPVPSIWGNIITGIKVGKSSSQSLDFFYDVIPFAKNLISLQHLKAFGSILRRLDIPSHERLSTMLEVQVAANYQTAGYKVELQPKNGKGGACDTRIYLEDKKEWIYVECKILNSNDSQRLKSRQQVILDLAQTILERTKPFLPLTHRIEIQLSSRFRRQKNYSWLDEIIHSIRNNELESWKESSGIRYCISSIKEQLRPPTMHMVVGVVRLTGHPTPITGSGVHVSYSCGNFAQKIIHLIKDARNQLPDNQRGIIVIKSLNIASIRPKIGETFKEFGYKKIIGIVGLDETQAVISKNRYHTDISPDLLYRPTYKCS